MSASIPTCTAAPPNPDSTAKEGVNVLAPLSTKIVTENMKHELMEPEALPPGALGDSSLNAQKLPRVFMIEAKDSSVCPYEFCQSPGAIDDTPPLKASVLGNSMLTIYHCRLENHMWAACNVHPIVLFDMANHDSIDGIAGCPRCRQMELEEFSAELAQRDKMMHQHHVEVLPYGASKLMNILPANDQTYAKLAERIQLQMKTKFDSSHDTKSNVPTDIYITKANAILSTLAARDGFSTQQGCYQPVPRPRSHHAPQDGEDENADIETHYGSDTETHPPASPASPSVVRPISAPSPNRNATNAMSRASVVQALKHFIPLSREMSSTPRL